VKNKALSHALGGAALVVSLFFAPVPEVVAEEKPKPMCLQGGVGWEGVESGHFGGVCEQQGPKVIEAPPYQEPPREKSRPSRPFCKYGDLCTRFVGTYAPWGIPALEASGEEPRDLLKKREENDGMSRHDIARAGYVRTLPEKVKHDALAGLSWQKQTDGSITAVRRVRSVGAMRLRLVMKIAPEFNGELRFAPTGNPSDAVGPITRRHWERMVDLYHSPSIEGDDMLVEIRMPDGKIPPKGVIRFIEIGHMYKGPGAKNSLKNVKPNTLPCHNEVACAKTAVFLHKFSKFI